MFVESTPGTPQSIFTRRDVNYLREHGAPTLRLAEVPENRKTPTNLDRLIENKCDSLCRNVPRASFEGSEGMPNADSQAMPRMAAEACSFAQVQFGSSMSQLFQE